jgi:uncharacterized LabA/DUF88 family protein
MRTEARPAGAAREPSGGGERAATAGQRVAILLDAASLQSQARDLGAEVSYVRLLRGLAGTRPVIRAVAYVTGGQGSLPSTLAAHDIEVERCQDSGAVDVGIAVDALGLASRVDCVVIASASPALGQLARALRSHGLRVESASFSAEAAWSAQQHHQLGKSCLFVP